MAFICVSCHRPVAAEPEDSFWQLCPSCAGDVHDAPRAAPAHTPNGHVLVIPRAKAGLEALLRRLLEKAPEIRILVDRREGERRGRDRRKPSVVRKGTRTRDRRQADRRRQTALFLA